MARGKPVSRTVKVVGISVGALIVVVLLVIAFFPWNWLRGPASRALSSDLHRRVSIAALHGSLFGHPRVQVTGLTISNPPWAGGGQMVSIQRIELELRFWPLLRGEIVLPRVALIRPDVHLVRLADGRANWEFTSHPESAQAKKKANQPMSLPLVHRLIIQGGRLTARDDMHKVTFDGTVEAGGENSPASGAPSATAKAVKAKAQSQGATPSSAKQQASRVAANTGTGFKLLGKGELNDKPFTLRVSGGPLVWAETHKPYPFDVQMIASDIHASARGVLPQPFDLTHLDVTLSLAGKDLADGYYLTGVALPDTPPYSLSGHLHVVGTKYEFTDVKGRLGGSDIGGLITMRFVGGGYPALTADLTSRSLNLADLGPIFGGSAPTPKEEAQAQHAKGHPSKAKVQHALTQGVATGLTAKSAEKKVPPSRFLLPTAKLQVDRLRGMNATLRYRADEIKSQTLPLKKVDLKLRVRDSVLHIDPFAFTLPEGEIAGSAVIDARERIPAERLDVRLTHVQLAQFHTKGTTHPPFEGTLVGRLKVHGTGYSMHAFASTADGTLSIVVPHGDIEQAFAEFAGIDVARGLGLLLKKSQQQTHVRCGVADFEAVDGIAKVKQVVFDTQVVILTGLGDINLRNERIKLQLTGQPKKFRFAVLRTPVEIRGTLSHPAVGLKGSKLAAQGAAATVLGAIATPLAAVAAFVDPGLNKSADCQQLLADAKAMGAPVRSAKAPTRTGVPLQKKR
ncbi:MAG TPA: AsmA family protein [Steroidobacteraceae bacterium]|nr:AsmA family protein [Steroidobacteraceae bacterium]